MVRENIVSIHARNSACEVLNPHRAGIILKEALCLSVKRKYDGEDGMVDG